MKTYYKADPLSRNQIRQMVKKIRQLFDMEDSLYVNVMAILERVLPVFDEEFEPLIVEDHELGALAVACPEEHTIIIRESVYLRARAGNGWDRFTIMHEIGHYILHDKASISFARGPEEIRTFEDPEWQADVFSGEFLMAYDLIKDMKISEIAGKCGVTLKAASCQYKKIDRATSI